MAIELDIEDILGAGCLTSIGRSLAILSCLWLGAATGSLGYWVARAVVEVLEGGRPELLEWAGDVLVALAWGPLMIFAGTLLPLFFPLAFAVYFMLGRGDGVTLRSWLVFTGVTGLLVLLSMFTWGGLGVIGIVVSVVLWAGFAGSVVMLAVLATASQRRRFSEHLMGIEAENSDRRRLLAAEFGTATADREFATGEIQRWHTPPEPKQAHPKVPLPPRREAD